MIGLVGRDRVKIKKAGFTSVALFLYLDLNANKRRFVREHVNKSRMRNSHEILIVTSPVVHFLFPTRIFPDNNGAYSLFHQEVNDPLAGSVQAVVHLSIALLVNLLHLPADTLSLLFGEPQLEFFLPLFVPWFHGFRRPTVTQP